MPPKPSVKEREKAKLRDSRTPRPTALLVLADGSVFFGHGIGAEGRTVGEICFNTSMTGYQEILTDPSYEGQMIVFTFPHIGNVGVNDVDIETQGPAARGLILRADITEPSNWRALGPFDAWLKKHKLIGISGIDTRALTARIRDGGAPSGVICHAPDGAFDLDALKKEAAAWPGLDGMDLALNVTCGERYEWTEGLYEGDRGSGFGGRGRKENPDPRSPTADPRSYVVAIDYGAKRNILRCLVSAGCRVTVVPAQTSAEAIFALKPDGVFLSNGPGDPAATGVYAVPVIKAVLDRGLPLFGICLGHQMLGLALGARTTKMPRGHRGANHPVKDLQTGKVEITSQNHGFMVIPETLPRNAEVTHISLFDGSNEGFRLKDKPAFSVQYHPEASPGPHDAHYLFERFVGMMKEGVGGRDSGVGE